MLASSLPRGYIINTSETVSMLLQILFHFKLIPTGVLTGCLRGNQGISDTVEWREKENIVMCQIRLHQAYYSDQGHHAPEY